MITLNTRENIQLKFAPNGLEKNINKKQKKQNKTKKKKLQKNSKKEKKSI